MNPFFQDIYADEIKLNAAMSKIKSNENIPFIPIRIHERISDRLINLTIL